MIVAALVVGIGWGVYLYPKYKDRLTPPNFPNPVLLKYPAPNMNKSAAPKAFETPDLTEPRSLLAFEIVGHAK